MLSILSVTNPQCSTATDLAVVYQAELCQVLEQQQWAAVCSSCQADVEQL